MGNAIDRLLLGGAFVFGGLIHRKVGQVDDRVGLVEDVVEDLALSPQVPGMPLPTGYGLQVKGPASEDILIPVCLPPGFELGSLVLKPSFLPDEEQAADRRRGADRPASAPPAPAAAAAPSSGALHGPPRRGDPADLLGGVGVPHPGRRGPDREARRPSWSGTPRCCRRDCLTLVRR